MYKNYFTDNIKSGVTFLTSGNIKARHAFTTRLGGVSGGCLSSLNLGENRGDAPENVRENYARVSAATGIDTLRMVYTNQVHASDVLTVAEKDARGHFEPIPYECDGVVTNVKNLPIACFTADCVPVLLCDIENSVIGAVHCGWRSSVRDILKNAVEQMCALGAKPWNISAAVGPAIGFCCFEVGVEVIDACEAYIGDLGAFVKEKPNGKFLLDLKAVNAERLSQLGLKPENVSISPDCTMCMPEKYFSHRYGKGERGSMGALIAL